MLTLGIDLGSRTVKAVLYDGLKNTVLAVRVADVSTDTKGDARAIRDGILADASRSESEVVRILATGYGRSQAEFASATATEITCHATGVFLLIPEARTVIDMGGQDSKAILLSDRGAVLDFAMNDRCAAGTGRFLEVVAKILGTDLKGMAALAQEAGEVLEISSTCVVFAESEVLGMLARGVKPPALAAGIFRSLARRVAGLAELIRFAPPVVFTGGVAMNRAMTIFLGKEIREKLLIPPDPRITAALGAAVMAARQCGKPGLLDVQRGVEEKAPCPPRRPSLSPASPAAQGGGHSVPAVARFDRMISNCLEYAEKAKGEGKRIVSIFCEYTPREIIMAAGGVPVLMCGGSYKTSLAAEKELPANLCPLIKSSYGYVMEKSNPFYEMADLIVAETTCDGKKKVYELLAAAKPVHILELTQKPEEDAAFHHWKREVESLKERMESVTGSAISPQRLLEAIRLMNRERRLRREIAAFAGRGLRGSEVLLCKSSISCIPEDLDAYEEILFQLREKKTGPVEGARILMTGVPMPHGAEKVLLILEEAGATVIVQENCTGIKPLMEEVSEEGDSLEAIALKYFHLPCSCMMPNQGRFDLIDRLVDQFRPHGILDLIWQACHTYNIEATLMKKYVEEKHKIPYLKIETDYSPSDTEQLRLRIEAFVSMAAG